MAGPGSKSGGRSEVFRKLARQRREPEPRPESVGELEPESGSASSEGSSKSGLPAGFRARLDGRHTRARGEEPVASAPRVPRRPGPPRDLEAFENERGSSWARVLRYPLDHLHGNWRLEWTGGARHELDRLG